MLKCFSGKLATPFNTCFCVSFHVISPRGRHFCRGDSSEQVCFRLNSIVINFCVFPNATQTKLLQQRRRIFHVLLSLNFPHKSDIFLSSQPSSCRPQIRTRTVAIFGGRKHTPTSVQFPIVFDSYFELSVPKQSCQWVTAGS